MRNLRDPRDVWRNLRDMQGYRGPEGNYQGIVWIDIHIPAGRVVV